MTNEPNYIDHIETKPSIISDHKSISCLIHEKELREDDRQMKKTEWWRLNPDNLVQGILQNKKMMSTLSMTNGEKVWTTLIEGFNEVVNNIAPSKIVQCKRNYQPYIDKEILEEIEETNKQLELAIMT